MLARPTAITTTTTLFARAMPRILGTPKIATALFSSSTFLQAPPPPPPGAKHFVYSHHDHPLEKGAEADPRLSMHQKQPENYLLFQPVYTDEEVNSIKVTHVNPPKVLDRVALLAINTIRGTFDLVTGYGRKRFTEENWLQRIIFLETVAGVPGMVGGMHRHMRSLRTMQRDRGWVHTLLEECENERMHLLTFLKLKQPGAFFRFMVLMGQGVFFNLYFLFYWTSPAYCHRFVGYLEEEAVRTYTHLIEEIDHGHLPAWKDAPAPEIAKGYWRLKEGAKIRDLVLAVRADEANHRDVNHALASIKADDANPFSPPPDEVQAKA